jgi:hypothetical protein
VNLSSLGDLVDRLSIVNLKLWFVQDEVHSAARQSHDLPAETVKKLMSLNLERNRLMTEIDVCLDQSIARGGARIDSRVKLT